jgi:hypothetical protein
VVLCVSPNKYFIIVFTCGIGLSGSIISSLTAAVCQA